MQPTRTSYNFGKIREAGSLETPTVNNSRTLKSKSTLTDVELSHQYDELFIQPVDNLVIVQPKKQTKSVSKQNTNFLRYDLDKIDLASDQSEYDDEQNKRHESSEITRRKREEFRKSRQESKPRDMEKRNHSRFDEKENNDSPADFRSKSVEKFANGNNPFLARSLTNSKPSSPRSEDSENNDSSGEDGQLGKDVQVRPKSAIAIDSSNDHMSVLKNDFTLEYFNNVDEFNFLFREAPKSSMVRCQIYVHTNKLTTNDYELNLDDYSRDAPLLWTQSKGAVTGVNMTINTNLLEVQVKKYRQKKVGKLKSDLNRHLYELIQILENQFTLQQAQLIFRKQAITSPMPKELDISLRSTPPNDPKSEQTHKLMTKSPEYDRASKTYKLDFKGRAKKVSYNNMQITNAGSDRVVWQLGKVRKNHYILDFAYPFSMFTAFGVALTCMSK